MGRQYPPLSPAEWNADGLRRSVPEQRGHAVNSGSHHSQIKPREKSLEAMIITNEEGKELTTIRAREILPEHLR